MTPNLDRLIALAIISVLAGAFTGILFRGKQGSKEGDKFLLGLGGAILGGWVFTLLNVDLQLGVVRISIGDAVEALVGTLLLVGIFTLFGRQKRNREPSKA